MPEFKNNYLNLSPQIEKQVDNYFLEPRKKYAFSLSRNNKQNILFMKVKSFQTESNFKDFLVVLTTNYPKNSFIYLLNHYENCILLLQTNSDLSITKISFHKEIKPYHISYFSKLM